MNSFSDLQLVERRTHRCRLNPEEVSFLHTHHRQHLDLAPTSQRNHWNLTPRGVVGVIRTPVRRIVIEPKISAHQFLYLLESHQGLNFSPQFVHPEPTIGLLDLLAGMLASLLKQCGDAGLHREYREQSSQGAYVVGAIDLPATLRQPPINRDQLHSRSDNFTTDIPWNQVPASLARRFASSSLLQETTKAQLRQALQGFDEVSDVAGNAVDFAELPSGRVPALYRPLIEICQLLGETFSAVKFPGESSNSALLISMERIFEQYLTRVVQQAFSERSRVDVFPQRSYTVGAPQVSLRPDVSVERDGKPVVVLDAKWKRRSSTTESADLHQMIAYAELLPVSTTILVYPGRGGHEQIRFAHSPVVLERLSLQVNGTMEQCRRAQRRLVRRLRGLV